jgi:hypothetical protein
MKKEGGWKASNNLSYVGAMEGQHLPSLSDASSLLLHLEMLFVEEGAAVSFQIVKLRHASGSKSRFLLIST